MFRARDRIPVRQAALFWIMLNFLSIIGVAFIQSSVYPLISAYHICTVESKDLGKE